VWMRKRTKYSYLTDNWSLNEALNELDAEISRLRCDLEYTPTYEEFDELRERVEKLEKIVEGLAKALKR